MYVFNGVTSARVIILLLRFIFNLSYGLKPQVSGIKIVTVFRRSIFQVKWLIATLIFCRFYFGMEFTFIMISPVNWF